MKRTIKNANGDERLSIIDDGGEFITFKVHLGGPNKGSTFLTMSRQVGRERAAHMAIEYWLARSPQ